jgi:hypothetical protein
MSDIIVTETPAIIEGGHYELSVKQVAAQVSKIHECMKSLMTDGVHYGQSFPGDIKKNLLKPGADKLCFMFRFRPEFVQDIKELAGGHREISTRCAVYHIDTGRKIAEGVGLCTTLESKYRWRNSAKKCPQCGAEAIIKGKAEYGGGWVCFQKKGGCGAKFRDGDPAIEGQKEGKVENPDIADTYNTVMKMSKKRAYVDAVITACAASDIFTQDIEDNEPPRTPTVMADNDPPKKPAKTAGYKISDLTTEIKGILNSHDKNGDPVFDDAFYNTATGKMSALRNKPTAEADLLALIGELRSAALEKGAVLRGQP